MSDTSSDGKLRWPELFQNLRDEMFFELNKLSWMIQDISMSRITLVKMETFTYYIVRTSCCREWKYNTLRVEAVGWSRRMFLYKLDPSVAAAFVVPPSEHWNEQCFSGAT